METLEIALPTRGGSMHGLAWGPRDRPVDVVFLHANGFNAHTYRTILGPLGEGLRVLALDQRGHGLTKLPAVTDGREDWLDLRDDFLAALEAQGIENAVLSGHSMGGTVAILAAAAEPRIARSLVLFDPVIVAQSRTSDAANSPMVEAARRRRPFFENRQAAFVAYRGRGAFRTWPDEILTDYLVDGLRDMPNGAVELTCAPAWEASSYAVHGHDTTAALATLTRPTRILKATANSTCRLGQGDVKAPASLDIETVPQTTHFLPMERSDLVRLALASAARG